MSKGNGTGVRKQTRNNVQRVNKQNQSISLPVQTRTGTNPVNAAKASSTKNFSTARQSVNRKTVLSSTAQKVNTVQTMMSDVRSANVFHTTNSPSSRLFKRTTELKTNLSNQKVYTAKVKEVSTVGEKWVIAVKSLASCKWRIPGYNNDILSKYNGQQESNQNEGTKDKIVAGDSEKEDESAQDCFEVPFWHSYSSTNTSSSKSDKKRETEPLTKNLNKKKKLSTQAKAAKTSSTKIISTVSTTAKASGTNFVNTVSIPVSTTSANEGLSLSDTTNFQEDDTEIPPLKDIHEMQLKELYTFILR
ncbi:hypothetical protein Tco_1293891 [Tanacetum coccineum]